MTSRSLEEYQKRNPKENLLSEMRYQKIPSKLDLDLSYSRQYMEFHPYITFVGIKNSAEEARWRYKSYKTLDRSHFPFEHVTKQKL